jgi:hypothetical protein
MTVNDQAVILKPSTNTLGQSQYRGTNQSAAVGRERRKGSKAVEGFKAPSVSPCG